MDPQNNGAPEGSLPQDTNPHGTVSFPPAPEQQPVQPTSSPELDAIDAKLLRLKKWDKVIQTLAITGATGFLVGFGLCASGSIIGIFVMFIAAASILIGVLISMFASAALSDTKRRQRVLAGALPAKQSVSEQLVHALRFFIMLIFTLLMVATLVGLGLCFAMVGSY